MTRSAFFAALRRSGSGVFGTSLSEIQVAVLDAILDQTKRAMPRAHVAYIMATAYHETGTPRMVPSRENLNYSPEGLLATFGRHRISEADAQRLGRIAGRPAQQREIGNIIYGGKWGRENLGNTQPNDGWMYRGGGLEHLTGRTNHERTGRAIGADLLGNPDLMLQPAIAVRSIVTGMVTGRYTGQKLADYDGARGYDFVAARTIINNDVRKNGALIAGYARAFDAALAEAGLA
jgi:putative chitinase